MCGEHLSLSAQAEKFTQMKSTGMDCLKQQTVDGNICACSETFEAHEKLLGPLENETEKYERILEKDRKKAFIEAYRKEVFNKIDDALRSDILLEKGKLNPMDLYQKKECSMSSFYSSIQTLQKSQNEQGKCRGLYKNASIFFGKKVTKENLDQVTKDWSDNIANYSEKILSNKPLKKGGFPAKSWYMTKTPSAASMSRDFTRFAFNVAEQKDNPMFRSTDARNEEVALYVDSKDYRDYYNTVNEEAFWETSAIDGNIISKKENRILALFMSPPSFLRKTKGGREIMQNLTMKWKAFVSDSYWGEKDSAKKTWKNIEDFLTDRDNLDIAFKAIDSSCKQAFSKRVASDIFCSTEATLSAKASLKIVTPEMTMQVLRDNPIFKREPYKSDKDVQEELKKASMSDLLKKVPNNDIVPFFIAKANYMKFCPNGQPDFMSSQKTNAEEVVEPVKVGESHLQKLINGADNQYDSFSTGVGAIFKKHKNDHDFEAIKKDLLNYFLTQTKAGPITKPEKSEPDPICKKHWVKLLCSDSAMLDYQRAEDNISAILDLPEGKSSKDTFDALTMSLETGAQLMEAKKLLDDLKAQQKETPKINTIARYLAPSNVEKAKTPIFSTYTQRSNTDDVKKARIVSAELTAARIERRPVNQAIVNQNAYKPRDFKTGKVIASAPVVNGLNRIRENNQIGIDSTKPPLGNGDSFAFADQGNEKKPSENSTEPDSPKNTPPKNQNVKLGYAATKRSIASETPIINENNSSNTLSPRKAELAKNSNSKGYDLSNIRNWSTDRKKEYLQKIMKKKQAELNRLENAVKNLAHTDRMQNESSMQNEIAAKQAEISSIKNYIQQTAANQVAQENLNNPSWGQTRASAHSDFGQEGRFPAAIANGKRKKTSTDSKKKGKKIKNKGNRKGSDNTASGTNGSAGKGGGGGSRGIAGANLAHVSTLKINTFKKNSLNDCYAPNLYYIYPCFIHISVLKNIEIVDDMTSRQGQRALDNPRRLVHDLGLEGKIFAVARPMSDRNEEGEEQIEIISYDWEPPNDDMYPMLDNENFRNKVVKQIYNKRWDIFYLKKEASRARIYKRKVVTRKELNQLMTDRQTEMLVNPTAKHLIQNVMRMNIAAQKDHELELNNKINNGAVLN